MQTATVWLLLALTVSGCSKQAGQTDGGAEEVSIPVILIVDSSTGIRNEENVIQAFNQNDRYRYFFRSSVRLSCL